MRYFFSLFCCRTQEESRSFFCFISGTHLYVRHLGTCQITKMIIRAELYFPVIRVGCFITVGNAGARRTENVSDTNKFISRIDRPLNMTGFYTSTRSIRQIFRVGIYEMSDIRQPISVRFVKDSAYSKQWQRQVRRRKYSEKKR
jgi:hypothetical protein